MGGGGASTGAVGGDLPPAIDCCYPFAAAAFRHLESGHAHGKIVVTIASGE